MPLLRAATQPRDRAAVWDAVVAERGVDMASQRGLEGELDEAMLEIYWLAGCLITCTTHRNPIERASGGTR
jgi:hypothetical protein